MTRRPNPIQYWEPSLPFTEWLIETFGEPRRTTAWWERQAALPGMQAQVSWTVQAHVIRCFENAAELEALYDDEQLAEGLVEISMEDGRFVLVDPSCPWSARRRAHQAQFIVFRDLFAKRCPLSANPPFTARLDNLCFEWWENMLLCWFNKYPRERERLKLHHEVMEQVLYLENDTCRWGALFGLSESSHMAPRRVRGIIERFLSSAPNISRTMRAYAPHLPAGMRWRWILDHPELAAAPAEERRGGADET